VTHKKPTPYFYGDKTKYIHSNLHVVLCLSFHIHNCVKNISKHIFFIVHDIKVMTEEIGLPIKKLSENTSLYPIINELKPEKFCLLD